MCNTVDVRIKDLYAGKPDARDEINYDGLEDFIKTFVVPSNFQFNIDRLINKNACFITGYKGTGKTALLFYLDDYIQHEDSAACSSFIFFKEEFTDAKKSELEQMSHRILSSISISSDTMLENTDFEYIWRWLLLKHIIADNEAFNGGLFVQDESWNAFVNVMNKIKAPSDLKKTIIPPKIKLAMSCTDPASMSTFTPELEVDFKKSGNDDAYVKFIRLIDEAETLFTKVIKTDIPYYIFIDELEAYYGDLQIFKRDLYMIRDLIFTVKRLNSIFMQICPSQFKIICSVRSEIVKAISRFIVTKELNKVISGFEVPLIWDYNNTSSYLHPIMQILLKRIEICENDNNLLTQKEIYQKWFPETIHYIEPANYILNNSWFKPRDIVRLLTSAQNSIESNAPCFNQSVFNACQKRYSQESLLEIQEEMRALYTAQEIDTIINCFTGFRTIFSYKQLQDRINQLYQNTTLAQNLTQVVEDLYRLGFLGNFLPASKTYRWQHKGDDHVIISPEWRLMVHHALHSALSIGKKQDYGLKYHDEPQIGDVVEVTVVSISRSFVFVTFEKNAVEYQGVIHISQLKNGYIADIFKCVDYGDTFNAIIMDYNTEHSNWVLSKKAFHTDTDDNEN